LVKTTSGAHKNILIHADNLKALQQLSIQTKVDLIYIDPPFATNKDFHAKTGELGYSDKIVADEFLSFLRERLALMKTLLSETGSIYVHLDQRMSHEVKLVLDDIFGRKNFRNEIIWKYVSGGISDRFFARKHDTIFFYTKSDTYTFNPQRERRKLYNQAKVLTDEKGDYVWYIRPNTNTKVPNGVKTYLDKYVSDVWDIPIVNPMAKERNGYPTQKPEALLERIIAASSNPGDIVADFFAGSGTTGAVAEKMGRAWIMCDQSNHAIQTIQERLCQLDAQYSFVEY
jgi:site-specific DNA-methyltransferase (adenine-specific)